MKSFTRNVSTYQVGVHVSAGQLVDLLPQFVDTPFTTLEARRHGFTPLPDTDSLVTPLATGWATRFRLDTRKVPASALKAEVARRAQAIRKESGRIPGRKELRRIKSEAHDDLLPKVLPKSDTAMVLYSTERERLYVTGSRAIVDQVLRTLVDTLESVQSSTINVSGTKQGLTPRLANYLGGDEEAFGKFDLGGEVVLISPSSRKWSVKHDILDAASETLREALGQKAEVDSIQLVLEDVKFRFTSKLRLAGIQHPTLDTEGEEPRQAMVSQLTTELANLDAVWDEMVRILAPEQVQAQAADTSASLF